MQTTKNDLSQQDTLLNGLMAEIETAQKTQQVQQAVKMPGEKVLTIPVAPRAEALASGAMVHTAHAHDEVLVVIDTVENLARLLRESIEAKRREADRVNREFIDLCSKSSEQMRAVEATLKAMGGKLIEQGQGA